MEMKSGKIRGIREKNNNRWGEKDRRIKFYFERERPKFLVYLPFLIKTDVS